MPFDCQSNKLTRTLSLRSLRRRSTGGSTTPVSGGSTFGDQLCRQLDAHLRQHSSKISDFPPHESLTRSQSRSDRLADGAKCFPQSKRGQDGRQSPTSNSMNGVLAPSPLPPASSPSQNTSHLNRKDSRSSANSFCSFQSFYSAESSGTSSSCQAPTSTSCAVKVKAKGEVWSEFKLILDSVVNPQSLSPVRSKTNGNKVKHSLRSKFRVLRSKKPKKSDAGDGMPHHLMHDQKAELMKSIPESPALHELPEPPSKDYIFSSPINYSRTLCMAPSTSLRVKFDPKTRLAERDPVAFGHANQRVLRPPMVRQPSIKRSLSISSSLDTIPEDTSRICLLSPTGMTL